MTNILAIDLGTGGPKAAVVSAGGEVLAGAARPNTLLHTAGGGIEQDPEEWWRATCAASRAAVAGLAPDCAPPSAVAVTAQWVTTVPIDAAGKPLMNAVSWMDGRCGGHARRATGPGPRVAGYNPLKLLRWLRRTGGAPSLQGHDPVGQIRMIEALHPEVHDAAAWFVEPGDFLIARMTGRVVTSAETATVCWGTDTRDISAIDYDDALLRLSGLDRAKLAPIVPTGSVVGELLAPRARELGIDPVPVIASTPDLMSAAVGSGAVADGAMHLYIGTSAWLSGHVPFRRTDALHNIATLPSSIPGRYIIASEQQTAGRSLEHLRDKLLAADGVSFEQLIAEAAAVPAGADGVIFTPWLNGERTPIDDPHSRASYTNLSLTSTRGALVRATLEGVAMNVRWMHEHTERLVGGRIDDIALIGGGAISDLWCQIISDVLDRAVHRVADPRAANVRGAALLGAMALGEIDADEIAALVPRDGSFTPEPRHRALYDERFEIFRRFHRTNRKMFTKLNGSEEE